MTIPTFPIPFPITFNQFVEANLTPNRRQAAGVIASGNDFVVDRGAPQWSAQWKTRTLIDWEMGLWEAWASSLRGAQRYFLGFDPRREYPLAYMPTGWPKVMTRFDGSSWNGTANLSGIGVAVSGNDLVSLNTLPSGFILSVGDYLSIAYGSGLVSLHRCLSSAIATSGGVIAALWVEPELNLSIATGATVTLFQASAKMRVTKFAAPKSAEGGLRVGSVSLEGLSVAL